MTFATLGQVGMLKTVRLSMHYKNSAAGKAPKWFGAMLIFQLVT